MHRTHACITHMHKYTCAYIDTHTQYTHTCTHTRIHRDNISPCHITSHKLASHYITYVTLNYNNTNIHSYIHPHIHTYNTIHSCHGIAYTHAHARTYYKCINTYMLAYMSLRTLHGMTLQHINKIQGTRTYMHYITSHQTTLHTYMHRITPLHIASHYITYYHNTSHHTTSHHITSQCMTHIHTCEWTQIHAPHTYTQRQYTHTHILPAHIICVHEYMHTIHTYTRTLPI